MQKLLPALVLIVMAGLGLALWQPWTHAQPMLPGAAPPEGHRAEPESGDPLRGRGDTDARHATQKNTAQPQREAVDAPKTTPRHDGPVLRVVDGDTGAPVPGATVLFFRGRDMKVTDEMRRLRRSDPFELLATLGEKLRCDGRGEVRLPRLEEQGGAGCKHGGKSGLMELRPGPEEFVLELHAELALSIRVEDATGTPVAGIPVTLAGRRAGGQQRWNSLWQGESGEGGVVAATGAAALIAASRDTDVREFAVFAMVLCAERPRVDIDLDNPPDGPVVLTLPPMGSVEVMLEHHDPARLEGATVQMFNAGVPSNGLDNRVEKPTENGRVVFDRVGVGLQLEVHGQLAGGNFNVSEDVTGPVAGGQRVLARIPMVDDTPVLIADLRNEDDEPLQSISLSVLMEASHEGSSWSSSFSTKTNPEGRIHMRLEDDLSVKAERSMQLTHEGKVTRTVKVDLPQLRPGENHLGVLSVVPPPLICSGTVWDANGAPIAGAQIEIRRKVIANPARPGSFHWTYLDLPRIRTDSEGAFAVQAITEAGEHGVTIRAKNHLTLENQPFAVGSAGLEFRLRSAAGLTGKLLLGDLYIRRHYDVTVAGSQGEQSAEPSADGSFRFGELEPGRVTLTVRILGDPEPVYVQDGILVNASDETRIADIDLRDRLNRVGFNVVDVEGRPVARGSAVVMHPDNEKMGGVFLDGGRVEVLSRTRAISVLLFADGHQNRRVDGVTDGQEITLQPRVEIVLRLPPGVSPPPGTRLRAHLVAGAGIEQHNQVSVRLRSRNRSSSMSGSVPWQKQSVAWFDANGVAVLETALSGYCSVRWSIGEGAETRDLKHAHQPIQVPTDRDRIEVLAEITTEAMTATTGK